MKCPSLLQDSRIIYKNTGTHKLSHPPLACPVEGTADTEDRERLNRPKERALWRAPQTPGGSEGVPEAPCLRNRRRS